jgi:hypothetical protein
VSLTSAFSLPLCLNLCLSPSLSLSLSLSVSLSLSLDLSLSHCSLHLRTHFQMMPDVPMVGWDVTFTPKGVFLLEVQSSSCLSLSLSPPHGLSFPRSTSHVISFVVRLIFRNTSRWWTSTGSCWRRRGLSSPKGWDRLSSCSLLCRGGGCAVTVTVIN